MEKLFLTSTGVPWKVSDEPDMAAWVGGMGPRQVAADQQRTENAPHFPD